MDKFVCLILTVVIFLAGCGSKLEQTKESKKPTATDKKFQPTKQNQEPTTKTMPAIEWKEPELIGSVDDVVAWKYKFEDIIEYRVSNGKIYATCSDHGSKVFCLDAKTGQLIWINSNNTYSSQFLHENSSLILLGNVIECLDAHTGKSKWITKGNKYSSVASLTINRLFVVTYEDSIHCIDTDTGKINWKTEINTNNTGVFALDDYVFYACENKLTRLEINTGKQLWQCKLTGIPNKPSIYNGKVYFGTTLYNQSESGEGKYWFYCFDLATGVMDWSIELDHIIPEAPLIVNGYAYTTGSKYICINLSERKLVWQLKIERSKLPVYSEDKLHLFIDDDWFIVDAISGKKLRKLNLGGDCDFNERKSFSITGEYLSKTIQCKICNSFITDDMFDQNSDPPLQRVYKSSTVYISAYNNGILCHTWDKVFWETPSDWLLVKTFFNGNEKRLFGVFGDKVMLAREAGEKQLYVCLDKETGNRLWEIDKGKYSIDSVHNSVLTLYSAENLKRIDINDGTIKVVETQKFDKMILFEILPTGKDWLYRPGRVQEFTEGYYLYISQGASKGEPVGDRYCIDSNGKMTLLYNQDSGRLSYIKRLGSKFYVCIDSDPYYQSKAILTEVDVVTSQTRNIGEDDVPEDAVLLNFNAIYNKQNTYDLSNDIINKIGVKLHKPGKEYYSHLKGINSESVTICLREVIENIEYAGFYYDFTGVYDTKRMKKLWSFEKKIEQIYIRDSVIVLSGHYDSRIVMFNDLKTGKTLLKYDKGELIGKVGDVCFVSYDGKIIAINLKKLSK